MISKNGPLAVQACKEAVLRTSGVAMDEAFKIEGECAGRVMRTKDAIEGPRAFMEKREAQFTGK